MFLYCGGVEDVDDFNDMVGSVTSVGIDNEVREGVEKDVPNYNLDFSERSGADAYISSLNKVSTININDIEFHKDETLYGEPSRSGAGQSTKQDRSTDTGCQNDFFVQGLTPYQKDLISRLASEDLKQDHLFNRWKLLSPPLRRSVARQLEKMDREYIDGGLEGYIRKAQHLLDNITRGYNPLDGWIPSVPKGSAFDFGTREYREMEKHGMPELSRVGFVIAAGGLGERLFKHCTVDDTIKLQLPTELATGTSYLQLYIEYIKAIQLKFGPRFTKLPLCIMVSKNTVQQTAKLLRDNKCYGIDEDQIHIIQQGIGVASIMDDEGRLAFDEKNPTPYLQTKPHGSGDIHHILYKSDLLASWKEKYNTKWLFFMQDTNGLAFHTLPLMIGVSKKNNLLMNSLAIPRKAGQPVGGITKVTQSETGEERTIIVEHNILDALLRGTKEYPSGDANDPRTGYSPFPGSANQILFQYDDYLRVLEETQGLVPEFIDPIYANETKTGKFQTTARLECMMQDFPLILENVTDVERVGFTGVSADIAYSLVKNNNVDGAIIQKEGVIPSCTIATGEADQYYAFEKMCLTRGIHIAENPEKRFWESILEDDNCNKRDLICNGIRVKNVGPQIIFKPDFITVPSEMKAKFPYPERVKITRRSSLIIYGSGVVIESLDLDGALIIKPSKQGERITIKDLVVRNQGWCKDPLNDETLTLTQKTTVTMYEKMRGYKLKKRATREITIQPLADPITYVVNNLMCA